MARFEQVQAPGQIGQSIASNYYDYLSATAQNNARIAADKARQIGSGASRSASIKKQNHEVIKDALKSFDTLVGIWQDKWMNRETVKGPDGKDVVVTGSYFNQVMSNLLNGQGGLYSRIDEFLANSDDLNDSDITTLQTSYDKYIKLEAGDPSTSPTDPFYNLADKLRNPHDYNDFISPNDPKKLYQKLGVGQYNLNGYWVDGTQLTSKVPATETFTNPDGSLSKKQNDPKMIGRTMLKLPDPENPQRYVTVGIDPNESDPSKQILYQKANGVVAQFPKDTYSPKFRNTYSFVDSSGAPYVADDGFIRPRTAGDDSAKDQFGNPLYPSYIKSMKIDDGVLHNLFKTTPVTPPTAPVMPPQMSPALPTQPVPTQSTQPKLLDVAPNFLQSKPTQSKVGAPASRFSSGFGGGGGGSF